MQIPVPGLKREIKLGDAIAKATAAVGLTPCGGCKQRAAALNGRASFVPMRSEWSNPPEVPEGWRIARMSNASQPTHVMFEYCASPNASPTKWIVWDVIDGAYRNSHSACCGAEGEAAVLAEYERRCR